MKVSLKDCTLHSENIAFAKNRNRLREITLGELFSGRLRNFVVALCFLTVFVHASRSRSVQWPFLSLRQNASEELSLAGLRQNRAIIDRNEGFIA